MVIGSNELGDRLCCENSLLKKSLRYRKTQASGISVLYVVLLLLLSCSIASATEYSSGLQYTFSFNYNENYIYKWGATVGSYSEDDRNVFTWTAPDVDAPANVVISVRVLDRRCSCETSDSIEIRVLPDETEPKPEVAFDITNSSIDEENEEIVLNPGQNYSENITLLNPEENARTAEVIIQDPDEVQSQKNTVFETENGTSPLLMESNLTDNVTPSSINISDGDESKDAESVGQNESAAAFDAGPDDGQALAMSGDSSSAVTSPDETTSPAWEGEIGAGMAADPVPAEEDATAVGGPADADDQTPTDQICTLSFDDGTEVDIIFIESSSFNDETYVISHEAPEDFGESGPQSRIAHNDTLVANTTTMLNSLIPESTEEGTDIEVNQTLIEENVAGLAKGQPDRSAVQPDSFQADGNAQANLGAQPETSQANDLVQADTPQAIAGAEDPSGAATGEEAAVPAVIQQAAAGSPEQTEITPEPVINQSGATEILAQEQE